MTDERTSDEYPGPGVPFDSRNITIAAATNILRDKQRITSADLRVGDGVEIQTVVHGQSVEAIRIHARSELPSSGQHGRRALEARITGATREAARAAPLLSTIIVVTADRRAMASEAAMAHVSRTVGGRRRRTGLRRMFPSS